MPTPRLRQTVSTAALLAAALAFSPAEGQTQVQNGSALDANQQVGSGGYNQSAARVDYRARNLLITGNVAGGRAFQGDIGYTAPGTFQGSLGSDSLFNFRRDSVFSSPNAGGYNYRAQQLGDRVIVSRPSDSLSTGFRVTGGNALSTRTTYDPGSGVVTFRQAGGGLVSISGFDNPDRLRNAGTSLGLVQTPSGLASVEASPLTGIRYNPLDASVPTLPNLVPDLPEPARPSVDVPETDDATTPNPNEPLSLRQSLRIDGQFQPDLTPEGLAQRQLRQDPLALVLGNQLQSQMALQLAGQEAPAQPINQATALRERVFGKQPTAEDQGQPPKAPENPYDKLIADILAKAKGLEPEAEGSDEPAEDTRTEWQKILEEPEKAVADAKLSARETALRLSLGLVDDEGNIDYETELPSVDADSELGKLLNDLAYDLPRVETLAGQDPNRINKLLSRGEQEIKAERYIMAENIYRQVLREKGKDPLAQAGLVHSQMGAGMIRSAAFNLRDLFAAHPELIALKYEDNLLPQTDRLRWLQNRLQKMIGEDIHGADPGLILAYLGYQLEAKPLIEFGLNVAESEAPRDPLMPVLRKIWIEGKDAEGEDAEK